ncbi:MAG: LysR family transcriptional regulator [Caldimonas sp.]
MPARKAPKKAPAGAGKRPAALAAPRRERPQARFRLRVTCGDEIAIGPGKILLLEAIGETGSLTAAARRIEMSYRRAWLLIDQLNRALARPAVASATGGEHGGGSELTEVGRQLIALYRGIEATAARACAGDIRKVIELLAR